MTGWVFGGWPPPPPSEGAFVTFDAVKAALALADTPIGFNNQILRDYVFDARAVLANLNQVAATIAPAATLSIPGPAVGFIRLINLINLTGLAGASVFTAALNPGGFSVGRAVAVAATGLSTSLTGLGASTLALGNGETLDITNGGANPITAWYNYYDYPSANLTLVRQTFGVVPVTVIPAAPAGFYRKFLLFNTAQNQSAFGVPRAVLGVFNDDTATIQAVSALGAAPIGRTGNTNANTWSNMNTGGTMDMVVTGSDLTLATAAAVTTRNAVLLGCYETFVGVP